MAIPKRTKIERVYVKVASEFDSTGYMLPTSITFGRLAQQTTTAPVTASRFSFRVRRSICSLNTSTRASPDGLAAGMWNGRHNRFIRRKGFINDHL